METSSPAYSVITLVSQMESSISESRTFERGGVLNFMYSYTLSVLSSMIRSRNPALTPLTFLKGPNKLCLCSESAATSLSHDDEIVSVPLCSPLLDPEIWSSDTCTV